MEFIFGIIVLILDIWAIVSIIGSERLDRRQGALDPADPDPAGGRLHHLVLRRAALAHRHRLS